MKKWQPRCIIRNINNGHPLLVLHAYKTATVVVDLEDRSNPTPTMVLLERDYDNWMDEKKMVCRENRGSYTASSNLEWKQVVL